MPDFNKFFALAKGPVGERLMEIFQRLYVFFGDQHWWPGETALEICIGAILTQNTSWSNVSKAIANLKDAGMLSLESLRYISEPELSQLIRPAGYYNIKAKRLKAFISHVVSAAQNSQTIENFFADKAMEHLRSELLSINGIGPETADSILLYAANQPTFVVDAYTTRALYRHNLLSDDDDYEGVRTLFIAHLPNDVRLFNEYHALWVAVGKRFCKKTNPLCSDCPLNGV